MVLLQYNHIATIIREITAKQPKEVPTAIIHPEKKVLCLKNMKVLC